MKLSIKYKLILFAILPAFVLGTVGLVIVHKNNTEKQTASIDQTLSIFADDFAKLISALRDRIELIAFLGRDYVSTSEYISEEEALEYLKRNLDYSPYLLGSRLYFTGEYTKGYPRLYSVSRTHSGTQYFISKDSLEKIKNEPWFKVTSETGKPFWDQPYIDFETKKLCIKISVPIFKSGKFIGISTAQIDVSNMGDFNDTSYYKSQNFILVSDSGKFIYHPDEKRLLTENIFNTTDDHIGIALFDNIVNSASPQKTGKYIIEDTKDAGDRLWVYYHRVHTAGWILLIYFHESELLAAQNESARNTILAGGISALILLFLTIFISNRITKPLHQFTEQVEQNIFTDNYIPVNIQSHDEIGSLASSFNSMIETITARTEEAKSVTLRLNYAMLASNDGVFDYNIPKDDLYFSERLFEILGHPPNHFTPTVEVWLEETFQEDREQLKSKLIAAVTKAEAFELEYRMHHSNESLIWVKTRAIVVEYDENKTPVRIVGIVTDITSQKMYELRLERDEARYKALIAASNSGAWEFNRDNGFMWCSNEYFSMLGYNPEDFDVSGTPNSDSVWLNLLHPDDRSFAMQQFSEYIESNSTEIFEYFYRMKHKAGHYIWIWARGRSIANDKGEVSNLTIGTHIDITVQKQTENEILELNRGLEERVTLRTMEINSALSELSKLNEKLSSQSAALNTAAIVSVVNADGVILEVNNLFEITSGYTREEIVGKNYRVLNSGYHSKEFWRDFWTTIKSGKIFRGKIQNKGKNGNLFWLDSVVVPVFDKNNEIKEFFSVRFDITEAMEAELARHEAEALIGNILKSVGEGIFGADTNALITFVNPQAAEMLGYTEEEILGKHSHDLFHHSYPNGDPYPKLLCPMRDTLVNGKIHKIEEEVFWRKDGTNFPIEYTSTPIKTGGKITGLVVSFRDVTSKKALEKELKKSFILSDTALDLAKAGSWEIDMRKPDYINLSRRACTITGFDPELSTVYRATDIFAPMMQADPENGKKIIEDFTDVMTGEKPTFSGRFRYLMSSGKDIKWLLVMGTRVTEEDGKEHIYGIVQDITDEKIKEEELNRTLGMADTALELAKAGFWDVPLNQQEYYFQSERASNIYGMETNPEKKYSLAEWSQGLVKADKTRAELIFKQYDDTVSGQKDMYDVVYPFIRYSDGKYIWVREVATVKTDALGERHLIGVTQDITEAKMADEILISSIQAANTIIDTIPVPTTVIEFETGEILRLNPAIIEFHGVPEEELNTQNTESWFQHNGQLAELKNNLKHEGNITNFEIKILRAKDGVLREVLLSLIPINYENKSAILFVFLDITDIKKIQSELQFALESSDRIIDSLPIPASVNTTSGKVLRPNMAMAEFHQMEYTALFNTNAKDWYTHPEERLNLIDSLRVKGFVQNADISLRRLGSGEERNTLLSFIPVVYRGEECLIGTIIDITELKQIQRQLEESREVAEVATRAKSQFLATMSHEIRTPMNAIIGLSHLALRTQLDRQQADYLNKIEKSAQNLLGIINEILDFSKIEAGKLIIENIPFDLDTVLDTVANLNAQRAQEKGLEFSIKVERDVPFRLYGDPVRVGQIITNFCSNAVKFTHKGDILVSVKVIEDKGDKIVLQFSVTDSGIGLSPDQMSKIFDSFSQADSSTTRKYGGTGLGLAICRRLAELMGGYTSVESSQGKGSTFSFTAEFGVQEHRKRATYSAPPQLQGMNILVVDDNEISRSILSEMLLSFSFNVTTVDNAKDAIELITNNPNGELFDLVLMDWKMPEMDGLEASRILLQENNIKTPTVVMVTAFGKADIAEKAENIGIKAFLTKPISHSMLFDTILEVQGVEAGITGKHRTDNADRKENLKEIAGARILLTEDNDINQQVATELLVAEGFIVDIASNGKEALDMIDAAQDNDSYNLVFMDLQMPVMDGFTATAELRKRFTGEELPIVAMTADAIIGVKEQCLEVGMQGFITKPINPGELFTALITHIPAEKVKPVKIEDQTTRQFRTNLLPVMKGINTYDGLTRLGNNTGLYTSLLKKFALSNKETAETIHSLLSSGNVQQALHIIHTLKGVSGNIGALELHNCTIEFEKNVKAEGINYNTGLFETLRALLGTALQSINNAFTPDKYEIPEEEHHQPLNKENLIKELSAVLLLVEDNNYAAKKKLDTLMDTPEYKKASPRLTSVTAALAGFAFEQAAEILKQLIREYSDEN